MKQILTHCLKAFRILYSQGYSNQASSLAFSTLLSLVPMLSVFVFLMTRFPIFTNLYSTAKSYIIENFVPTSSQEILNYLDKFTQQATKLPIFSIILLLLTATFLLISIDDVMNTIWHKKARQKNILALLSYPLIVLIMPLLTFVVALMSSILLNIFAYFPVIKLVSFIIPLFLNTLMLSVLYLVTSNRQIHLRSTLLGSFIAALLLELSKFGFAIYINQFSNYSAIYGALATIPVLLIWLYIFWLIVLYGAFIVKIRWES